ncbi:MAG: GspH/FimT family pseudopilin [Nitrospirota bacterium]
MDTRGFTLIELIVVVIFLSILAIIAVPRLSRVTDLKIAGAADKIAADIRYAQQLSMSEGGKYAVKFETSPNGYYIFNDANTNGIKDPSESYALDPQTNDSMIINLNTGVFDGITVDTAGYVRFDSKGVPNSSLTVTLNGGKKSINVVSQTGMVYVQ